MRSKAGNLCYLDDGYLFTYELLNPCIELRGGIADELLDLWIILRGPIVAELVNAWMELRGGIADGLLNLWIILRGPIVA